MSEIVKKRIVVTVQQLQHNDIIYLSDKSNATPFVVLDFADPFLIIENTKTHFASLFHVVSNIYKEV